MSQQIINIGATPNDGLGDPIRTAFEKTNENFANLFANTIAPYAISNGTSNVSINSANANITIGVNGTNNVATFTSDQLSVNGNITGDYFIGDGSQITGITASSALANALVGDTLSSNVVYSSLTSVGSLSNLDVVANITSGNVLTTEAVSAIGNVYGNYILGNGAYLTGVSGVGNVSFPLANGTSNLDITTANGNVTITAGGTSTWTFDTSGTLLTPGSSGTGNISGAYAISADYLYGDGSNITGLAGNYSNANVTDYLPTYSGNLAGDNLSITGNVYTDGKILHLGEITGNGIAANGAGIVVGANVATIIYDNTVFGWEVNQGWHPSANTSYNLGRSNRYWNNFYAVNINGTDVAIGNSISAVGNISANYFVGNGSQLTGISGGSSNANALTGSTLSSNVTLSSLTSVGTLSNLSVSGNVLTSGLISTTGNVIGNIFVSNTATLKYQANVFGWTTNSAIAPSANLTYNLGTAALWWNNFYAVNVNTSNVAALSSISAGGNVTGGNIKTAGFVSATGNITANYFIGDGSQLTGISGGSSNANALTGSTLSSNVTVSSLTTVGTLSTLSVSGNVTGNYFIGNGSQLTGINAGSVAANALTGSTLSSNVTVSSLTTIGTLGTLDVSGNTTSGNVLTGGLISATGNVTGNYFIGNGSQLTGISISSISANVLTGDTLSSNVLTSSLTSVGTLGNLSVTGNTTSGNFLTGGLVTATGNVIGSNLLTSGLISATGNVIGNIFVSNTSTIKYQANVFGWATNSAIAPSANLTYNLGTSALWWNNFYAVNVNTSNVAALSSISAGGNVTGGNIRTGGTVSATGNIYTAASISATGNINIASSLSAAGNITVDGSITTTGVPSGISGTGNIIGGNILTSGYFSATGNTYTNSVVMTPVALSSLTAIAGGRAFINDSNLVATGNFGSLVSGTGSNVVPVWSNGTNWYIG